MGLDVRVVGQGRGRGREQGWRKKRVHEEGLFGGWLVGWLVGVSEVQGRIGIREPFLCYNTHLSLLSLTLPLTVTMSMVAMVVSWFKMI